MTKLEYWEVPRPKDEKFVEAVRELIRAADEGARELAQEDISKEIDRTGSLKENGHKTRQKAMKKTSYHGDRIRLRILQLLSDGVTPDEIADLMQLTRSGLNYHIKDLRYRLHARTTTELIATALRWNIIS